MDATIKMKPVVEINPEYRKIFEDVIDEIKNNDIGSLVKENFD